MALALTSGCSAPAATPTPTVTPPTVATPSPVVTPSATATPAPSTPTASATPSRSAQPSASASASKRKPTVTIRCTPDVSTESGDPLLRIRYSVKDPDRVGWNVTLSYTNAEGPSTQTKKGRGDKTEDLVAYGLEDPRDDPRCSAKVTG